MKTKEWKEVKLSENTTKIGSGKTPLGGSTVYTKSGVLFLRSQNIYPNRFLFNDTTYIDYSTHQKMKSSTVFPDDVLLNITGASIGRCCVFPKELNEANVNQHVCIIRLNELLDPRYTAYFLNSEYGQRQIKRNLSVGNREGLNFQQIGTIKIPFPDILEQKKIAEILSTWDKAIEQQERLLVFLKKSYKSILKLMIDFNENPTKLSDVTNLIKDGTHGTHEESLGGIPLLSAKDIFYGEVLIPDDCRKISRNDFEIIHRNYSLEIGDVLLTLVGAIGRTAVIKSAPSYTFQRSVGIIRPNKRILPDFLYAVFKTEDFQKELLKRSSASAQAGVYLGVLGKIKVPVPEIGKQRKIINAIIYIEKQIKIEKQKKNLLVKQKQGLMQQLLTGKRRVKV